jgi:hypothetical protein
MTPRSTTEPVGTCGEPRPPYHFYCDKHLAVGEKADKPLLIDRLMRKILGRS